MIVTERMAQECWDILRQWARLVDEKWDADVLANVAGRTDTEVKDAFRAGAKHAHPDRGGDAAKFALLDRAKCAVLQYIEKGVPQAAEKPHGGVTKCPRCLGLGYLELRKGFGAPLRRMCPTCVGQGEIYDEREKDGDRL